MDDADEGSDRDDAKLSRRSLLPLSGVAVLEAACANDIPPRACCLANPPELFDAGPGPLPDPLPGFPAERRRLVAFDEIHAIDAIVHRPTSEADLSRMIVEAGRLGRRITLRAGGKSLGEQSLGKTVVLLDAPCFRNIGPVKRTHDGWQITCGAGARWGDVVRTISDYGFVPRTVVTTGDATIGGTASVDGVSRMAPLVGKESEQVVSFKMMDASGRVAEYTDRSAPEFLAAVAGFGALGVMTEVTLKIARAIPGCRARPDVETIATRYMPGTYDWSDLLRSIAHDTTALKRAYEVAEEKNDDRPGVLRSATMGLSIVCWFAGEGFAIDRLEHRYVHNEKGPRIPGGLYVEDSWQARLSETVSGYSPTVTQMVSTIAFPNGTYVDELCGFLFFLGNSAAPAIKAVRDRGGRLCFVQQTFVVPTPRGPAGDYDVTLARQFLFLVLARCRERELRPCSVDLLHLQADTAFLSATRGITGFAVTVTFADHGASQWLWVREALMALSNDVRQLGGRVHLVKNVEADVSDVRAMYRAGYVELKAVKDRLDPRGIFGNLFFDRFFRGWDGS